MKVSRRAGIAVGTVALVAISGGNLATTSLAAQGQSAAAFKQISGIPTSEPTSIFTTKPLSKKPPRGKTIASIQGAGPIYQYFTKNLKLAAKDVGWNVKVFTYTTSAAAAIQSAVSAKVDAIWTGGSLVKQSLVKPLADARAAGIPMFNQGGIEASQPDKLYYTTAHNNKEISRSMMYWIANDSKGKAKIAVFDLPEIPYFGPSVAAERAAIKAKCPDCTLDVVKVSLADFAAGKVGSITASYLQTHPNTTYVAYQFGDEMLNLLPPLEAAGLLKKVKIVCIDAGTQPVFKGIVDGKIAATGVNPTAAIGYWAVDYMSRWFLKEPIGPSAALTANAKGPQQAAPRYIVDYRNKAAAAKLAKLTYGWAGPRGYQDQFRKLWHLK